MYRHIPYATADRRTTGHHYINESRPTQQVMIEIHWDTMTVHVKTLTSYDANTWETVSVTPLNIDSPAEAPTF